MPPRQQSSELPNDEFQLTDEACLLRLQSGDRSALAILFHRYRRLVVSIGRRILRDEQEAEDVAQSVFVEVFEHAGRFDPRKGTVRCWLLQYAYHRSFNRKKYLAVRGHYQDSPRAEAELATHPQLWQGLSQEEARALLAKAFTALSAEQKRILEKVFFQGRTLREVAEEEGLSIGNVRHYYYRGLERLRKDLQQSKRTSI